MADRLLTEDEIKKELVDTCILICSFCMKQEEMFVTSERNESPFHCEDCQGLDEEDYIPEKNVAKNKNSIIT